RRVDEDAPAIAPALVNEPEREQREAIELDEIRRDFRHGGGGVAAIEARPAAVGAEDRGIDFFVARGVDESERARGGVVERRRTKLFEQRRQARVTHSMPAPRTMRPTGRHSSFKRIARAAPPGPPARCSRIRRKAPRPGPPPS